MIFFKPSLLWHTFFFISVHLSTIANHTGQTDRGTFYKDAYSFIENKGQLRDDQGNAVPDVKFYGHLPGVNIYFTHKGVVYEYIRPGDPYNDPGKPGKTAFDIPCFSPQETRKPASRYRMDMEFTASNPGVELSGSIPQGGYDNYYRGNDPAGHYTGVKRYTKITYRDIYPDIDLVFYTDPTGNGIKYDFIVHPGGDARQIGYCYKGADQLSIAENGQLQLSTPLGNLVEEAPYTYQEKDGRKLAVSSRFVIRDQRVSFETGPYNSTLPLVIDPSILVWSTYYGGNGASEQINHLTSDNNGYIYLLGNTSSGNFPLSVGAVQAVNGGGEQDGFVVKFSENGERIWGTYFGGEYLDRIRSGVADPSGNLFATGTTISRSFPLYDRGNGAYFQQVNHASIYRLGNPTSFIVQFAPSGTLTWSTYFGGGKGENGIGITLDANKNILLTGSSASENLPGTTGAFQPVLSGPLTGNSILGDAFIAKFNPAGTLQWATYYGGTENEIGYGIATDNQSNIYLSGWTESPGFPVSPGAFQTSYGGGEGDAFIAKFSSAGGRLWGTFYGGNGTERSLDCQYGNGRLYVSGYSSGNLPGPSGGAFQPNHAGGPNDGFIARLDAQSSNGQVTWKTFMGGSGDDGVDAIISDPSLGRISACGWTSSSNYPVMPHAYQVSPGGQYDAHATILDENGSLLCASYFGGPEVDNAYGIMQAGNGDVFIAGYTGSSTTQGFPVTPGAFQAQKAAGDDAFIARLSNIPLPPSAIFSTTDPDGCGPYTVAVGNQSLSEETCFSSTGFGWDFPGGTPSSSDLENPPPVTYPEPGEYTITLIVTNSTGSDTASHQFVIQETGVEIEANTANAVVPFGLVAIGETAPGALSCEWSLNDEPLEYTSGEPYLIETPGEYSLKLICFNPEGCKDSAAVNFTVINNIPELVVPDVFTPNGDQINDLFILQVSGIKSLSGNIYNRWGNLVYSWEGLQADWDGTVNSRKATEGTYYYVITATDLFDKTIEKKGTVTLLRD